MSRYTNAGQNKNFAKGYPFVRYYVTNKPLILAKKKNA